MQCLRDGLPPSSGRTDRGKITIASLCWCCYRKNRTFIRIYLSFVILQRAFFLVQSVGNLLISIRIKEWWTNLELYFCFFIACLVLLVPMPYQPIMLVFVPHLNQQQPAIALTQDCPLECVKIWIPYITEWWWSLDHYKKPVNIKNTPRFKIAWIIGIAIVSVESIPEVDCAVEPRVHANKTMVTRLITLTPLIL